MARESLIHQARFSADIQDFDNFNEITATSPATSVDKRKLSR
jgi:hypothetical protein